MSSLFSAQTVAPNEVNPVVGKQTQSDIMTAILGAAGFGLNGQGYPQVQGVASYPGQINYDVNQTNIPKAAQAWQPWDAGTSQLAKYIADPNSTAQNPILTNMMKYGGTGGPGNNAQQMMLQYGAPSSATGQPVSNMSQFGGSSTQTAQPINDLAYGVMSGPSKYLLPFLAAGSSPYKAPTVTLR